MIELKNLQTKIIGRQFEYYECLSSTQQELHKLAQAGANEGLVILAESQTNGYGQYERKWFSPPDAGIWMSLLLRPQTPLNQVQPFILMAAEAVTSAILHEIGLTATWKWPNDLLLDGQKVAGILAEARGGLGHTEYLIIGLGLNVNFTNEQFPLELRDLATSLSIKAGRLIDRASLLVRILYELERLYL